MQIFLGYFVWGLILAAPLSWLVWRFDLLRFLPSLAASRRSVVVALPPQLDALVIRGVRRHDKEAGR